MNCPTEAVSIVIPTYKEANNIPELVKRIAEVDFKGRPFELLIVDDNSQDGTETIVADLQKKYPWLRLIVRYHDKCLSRSVIEGFEKANHPFLIAMDADLSHPPEKIPEMLATLAEPTVDIVIGSRYITGGSSDVSWPLFRKIVSRFAAFFVSKILIRASVKDPLSGFVAVKKNLCLAGDPLAPIGWRVAIEVIIKRSCRSIREVPIHFSQRSQGDSKLNYKAVISDLRHVMRLMSYKYLNK